MTDQKTVKFQGKIIDDSQYPVYLNVTSSPTLLTASTLFSNTIIVANVDAGPCTIQLPTYANILAANPDLKVGDIFKITILAEQDDSVITVTANTDVAVLGQGTAPKGVTRGVGVLFRVANISAGSEQINAYVL